MILISIMQELGKFNFKTKCHASGLEKNTSFNDKLVFMESFQFLCSSLDSLVKNLYS